MPTRPTPQVPPPPQPAPGSGAAQQNQKRALWIGAGVIGAVLLLVCGCIGAFASRDDKGKPSSAVPTGTATPAVTRTVSPSAPPTRSPSPSPSPSKSSPSPSKKSGGDDGGGDPGGGDPGADDPGGTDPRFDTCKEAIAHGYGPYYRGKDPEYDWYQDRDGDGIVCERK